MHQPDRIIRDILFTRAQTLHKSPRTLVTFTRLPESDALLNDIEHHPHFFVLGCIMDRQIPAEKAWNIPYNISQECGGAEFRHFLSLDFDALKSIFFKKRLHRFNEQMAGHFHNAVRKIHTEYHDNAANIWLEGEPDSREVIARFAEFSGVGQKISTMATNILVREFKVPLRNVHGIDISVDSQIEKVFRRMGMVPAAASREDIIAAARKIYPEYPGIADSVIWEIGRDWCRSDLSGCNRCFLDAYCPKNPLPENKEKTTARDISVAQSGSSRIKPGKYRPRFEEIIRKTQENLPAGFHISLTSGRTNVAVKNPALMAGVHYEYIDWNDRISIELMAERSSAPTIIPVLQALSKRSFAGLPAPVIIERNQWVRLQFFFPDDVQATEIAESMSRLIHQTLPEITAR